MNETYIPLELKYRPKRLEDLVGQEVLSRTLTNAIKTNSVAPAILLHGSFGAGKTSTARIIAASLNCETSVTVNPCGKCRNCVDIFASKSPDVNEMDAASNSGVDEIRDLKKDACYMPVNGRWKVYILDEVHALTPRAEEALLKILEEPPQSVKFLLCSTDRHKIKNTILSRCQDFRVQTISWQLIASHLKTVCDKENITIDPQALMVVAKSSAGHMRDALKSLDKVILYAGATTITKDIAVTVIGGIDEMAYFDLIDSIIKRDFGKGMRVVQAFLAKGQSIAAVLDGLTEHLRTLLVIQLCDNTAGLIHLGEEEKKRYIIQTQTANRDLVDEMITHLVNIHRGIYYNMSPQVLLEQFLLKSIKSNYRLQASGS